MYGRSTHNLAAAGVQRAGSSQRTAIDLKFARLMAGRLSSTRRRNLGPSSADRYARDGKVPVSGLP